MKKLTFSIGYLSVFMVFIGIIFKIQHFPGANLLVVFGSFIFALCYAPLLFAIKNKTGLTGYSKFVDFWILIMMLIIPIGFAIKWVHWPGGGLAVGISNIALISLIPVMIIKAWKEKDELNKISWLNYSVVLIFISAFSIFLWFGKFNNEVFNQFISIDKTTQNEIKFFSDKTNNLFSVFENSVNANASGKKYFDIATELNSKSDSLVEFIKNLENEFISMSEQEKFPLDSLQKLRYKNDTYMVKLLMIENKKGTELKNKLISFREFASQNTNTRGKEILDLFFNTEDKKEMTGNIRTWEESKFFNVPMIKVFVYLNSVIAHIRLYESETMEYLQFMGSKEITVKKIENKPDKKQD